MEQYQAVCTLMGINREMLDLDDLHDITRAASLPVDQLVSMVGSMRKGQDETPSNLIDEELSNLADYVGCMNINTHQRVGRETVIRDRDEYASELYTKSGTISAIRSYFGGVIELDPASCAVANRTIRARRFFTKEMDGLKQDWSANRIFVNPPFCDLKQWTEKIKYEAGVLHNGKPKEMFVIVPCRETEWMKELLPSTTAVLMPHKRMQFWSERKDNIYIRDATFVLYFGPKENLDSVTHRFQNEYTVMKPQGVNTGGTMYTPDLVVTPDLSTPVDYDPVEHVKIGEKRELTDEQRRTLEELIRKNKKVVNPNPGLCRVAGARIETAEAKPINLPLRRTSPAQRIEIEKQVKELLELGMIKPSTSPWAAGIVMAPKPDGSWRFCVDYRMLNQVTVRDSYPLPRVDEYLHAMEGNTWFSVMDLNSGFWQIPLHPEDSKKTAFLSHAGLYEWVRMPMGLMNSPAVFQRVMDLAFAGMKWRNLLVYVDDVLVMSPTFERHVEDLQEAFDRLEALGMTVKPKKCQFACGEIKYLGHLLTIDGIKVNPEKVRAIKEMQWPDSPEKMSSFLGLVSYYRDFVKRCSDVCEPLNLVSKMSNKEYPKEPTPEQLASFNELKDQLTAEDNVLIRPDFEKMFYLQTDASEYGLSAILTQKDEQGRDKVVSYASRTLVKPERKWHSHELEALAAIWGCEHFRPYLVGRKFILQTDNSSITWLLKQVKPGRLQRWILRIQEFEYDIEHRPGKSNGNADGPSRNPVPYLPEDEARLEELAYGLPIEPMSMMIQSRKEPKYRQDTIGRLMSWFKEREDLLRKLEPEKERLTRHLMGSFTHYIDEIVDDRKRDVVSLESPFLRDAFRDAQMRDEECSKLRKILTNGELDEFKASEVLRVKKNYCVNEDGIVCINRRWKSGRSYTKKLPIVPVEYRDEILRLYHNTPHGGHLGGNKMYSRLRETFFWKNVGVDCKKYARGCAMCNSRKSPRPYYQGKMVIKDTVGPWENVSYDLISGFKTSKNGNTLCLVVMCEFTKGVEVIPLKDAEAETVARALVNEVFYRHGIPRRLHSDRGNNMNVSNVMKNACELLGISRSLTTAGHPEGNGQVERFNRFLIQGLYCLMNRKEDDWDVQIPALLFAYRTAIHPTTGETPFFLMHGRDAVVPGDLLLSKINVGKESHQRYARRIYFDLHSAFKEVNDRMAVVRNKQKEYYDKYHRKQDVEFSTGDDNVEAADLVVIYYQEPHVVGESTKFKSKWSIPYRVIRRMENKVNYEIQSLRDPNHRKVVHVSRMRKFHPWTPYVENHIPGHIDLSLPFPGYVPAPDEPAVVLPSEDYEIDRILDQYTETNGRLRKTWYLVHWAGYPEDSVSWVLQDDVKAIAVVKEWKKGMKKFTASQKRLINVLPSKRPIKFRRDDPDRIGVDGSSTQS